MLVRTETWQGDFMTRALAVLATILLSMSAWAADDAEPDHATGKANSFQILVESKHRQCRALASLEYFQRGAEAEVETSIHTDECDAASGSYVLHITVRGDDDTEPRILRFEESWERSDDSPVETLRRYPIGDDVDLLRIKSRKLSCTCAETTEDVAEQ